jgi:hypothetical protein
MTGNYRLLKGTCRNQGREPVGPVQQRCGKLLRLLPPCRGAVLPAVLRGSRKFRTAPSISVLNLLPRAMWSLRASASHSGPSTAIKLDLTALLPDELLEACLSRAHWSQRCGFRLQCGCDSTRH